MTLVTTLGNLRLLSQFTEIARRGGGGLAIAVNCGFSPIAESQACETINNSNLNLLI